MSETGPGQDGRIEGEENPSSAEEEEAAPQKTTLQRFLSFVRVNKFWVGGLGLLLLGLVVVAATQPLWKPKSQNDEAPPPVDRNSVEFIPIAAPSYPLAVRNPYLSTWMPGPFVPDLPNSAAQFWYGQSLGWSIIARVDGKIYNLFGVRRPQNGSQSAIVKKASYSSTHSMFELVVDEANFILDFFSPVSPSNYLRQSLPFSYYTVSASSNGSDIQIYTDIDATWAGQAPNVTDFSFNFDKADSTSMFSISYNDAFTYSQKNEMALWGKAILASRPTTSSNVTIQSGDREAVRGNFVDKGMLTGETKGWTTNGVVSISHDLGIVKQSAGVNFAIGYEREDAINYLNKSYTGFYRATYPTTISAISHFLDDYDDATEESVELHNKLATKSVQVAGQNYSDITTLSLVQAYGGIDVVIPSDTLDTNDTLAFIKEISSDGNVNTVDVIFPALPLYYALEPEYIRLLLEPIMRILAADEWPHPWVIHDIGSDYPNATGHPLGKAEQIPIEETGDLLMLAYAYVLATNNTAWTDQYSSLFRGYAEYLASHGLDIALQLSTNDAAGPLANETNLAVRPP